MEQTAYQDENITRISLRALLISEPSTTIPLVEAVENLLEAGILMEIKKETTTTDVSCHIFVVVDGVINIMGTNLTGTAEY